MKAAVLLVIVALVLAPHDAEAGFFGRVWQGIKNGARAVGDAVGKAARAVRDYIREKGISVSISRSIRDVSHLDHGQNYTQDIGNETMSMVYDIIKKSGVTLKSELDLTTVRELFIGADENKDGVLKGDDIVVFIALLEGIVHGENEVDPKGPK